MANNRSGFAETALGDVSNPFSVRSRDCGTAWASGNGIEEPVDRTGNQSHVPRMQTEGGKHDGHSDDADRIHQIWISGGPPVQCSTACLLT